MMYLRSLAMDSSTDVVIVGGGVIGSAIAYYLRKKGREVVVMERGVPGAEASSAAAGLLAPLGSIAAAGPFADLLLASWRMFPGLVPELEAASGITMQFEQTGSLRLVHESKRIANLRKRMKAWEPLGLHMEWLAGNEAREREPLLAPDVSAAIYAPEEGQILAPCVAQAFARAAMRLGATFCKHTEVTGVRGRQGRVTGVVTAQGEVIGCEHVVIAAGAWAGQVGEWLGLRLLVTPQRGQILAVRQPATLLRHIIFGEAIYLAPKQDETVVIGATKEDVGFSKQFTAGGMAWLLSTALRLVPSLEGSKVERIWAGLRPKTPDQQPILGKAVGWENVTLAVGHGSVGIALSPITGLSIAELISSGQMPELIHPFGLERFQ
jgi:glycine oxidase